MRNNTASWFAFSLLVLSSVILTACQRQEPSNPPVMPSVAVDTHPPLVAVQQTAPFASAVDNPAIKDLLSRVVRPDLPGMSFEQVKALFPTNCTANDDRSISCPGVVGLVSISYGGGPDGIFDMVFSGGMASCKTLKSIVSRSFGEAEDNSTENSDGVCDVYWKKISLKNRIYYATIRKQKGDNEVTLQIAAEQGP